MHFVSVPSQGKPDVIIKTNNFHFMLIETTTLLSAPSSRPAVTITVLLLPADTIVTEELIIVLPL